MEKEEDVQSTKGERPPKKPAPVAIQRLLDEVRQQQTTSSKDDYDRCHNRHNRS